MCGKGFVKEGGGGGGGGKACQVIVLIRDRERTSKIPVKRAKCKAEWA